MILFSAVSFTFLIMAEWLSQTHPWPLNSGSAAWQLPPCLQNMQPAVAAHGDFMDPSPPIICSIRAGEGQPPLAHSWSSQSTFSVSQGHRLPPGRVSCWWRGKLGSSASLPGSPSAETRHGVCLRKGCLFPFNKSHWSSWMLMNSWNDYFDAEKKSSVIRVGPRGVSEASRFASHTILLLWYWQVSFVPSFAMWKTGTKKFSALTWWRSEKVTVRTEVLRAARSTATCTRATLV